jgi:hypothetical protein
VTELSRYIFETLRKDQEFVLYRGRSKRDGSWVLVLSPVAEYSAAERLKRLEHEYSLREELDPAWAARPIAIARHWDRPVLVMDDPGGVPLDELLLVARNASALADVGGQPLERSPALASSGDKAFSMRLAISLSTAIRHLHQRGLIHKDIKPGNVLVNPATGQCWLMGFGIALRLRRERQAPESPSELFGHEKGAFTGATQRRLGRFELAEGGSLFLDEIGELPVETQIALLRVLQEREFERVGGTELLRADVRVIAATNRDLQGAITAGTFRSDLFYRLNVFPVRLPPLRERKEDIPALASYFIDRYAKRAGRKIRGVRKSALESLESYSWPGNIRELQNVIERSFIVCETDEFTIDNSWLSSEPMPTRSTDQESIVTSAPGERELIEAALARSNGKVSGSSGAAAKLGIPASTLESKIRSLKINKYRFR